MRRIVFFTGAGLSADSGIPTFRGAGGLYEGTNIEGWLTGTNYRREPAAIEAWISERRRQLRAASPNAAHRMIAEICREYPSTIVLTQNIDDLLERAGTPGVVHLHGTLLALRCMGRGHQVEVGYDAEAGGECGECGSRLRSDVVLFEEPAPLYGPMWRIFEGLTEEDALVVIGTEGGVIGIGSVARRVPGLRILNNLGPSEYIDHSQFHDVHFCAASSAAPWVAARLHAWMGEP
jgi:NAD-dependent deacetylase